jgi:uncharacterized FlaG/YvyC family protein
MEISSVQANVYAGGHAASALPDNAIERRELSRAVKAINRSEVLGPHSELTFVMDRASRRAILRIIDRKTGDVVMQLPQEYVLRMAEGLQSAGR